jgi:hypothetical protein
VWGWDGLTLPPNAMWVGETANGSQAQMAAQAEWTWAAAMGYQVQTISKECLGSSQEGRREGGNVCDLRHVIPYRHRCFCQLHAIPGSSYRKWREMPCRSSCINSSIRPLRGRVS